MSNFNYPIFPDREYTIQYPDFVYKITGEEIIATFRRGAYLEKAFEEINDLPSTDEIININSLGKDD